MSHNPQHTPTTKIIDLDKVSTLNSLSVAIKIWQQLFEIYLSKGGNARNLSDLLMDFNYLQIRLQLNLNPALANCRAFRLYWSFWPDGTTIISLPATFDSELKCPNVWKVELLGYQVTFTNVTGSE